MSTETEEKLLLLHQIIFDKDEGNKQPGVLIDVKYLSYSRNETDRLFQIIDQLQHVLENSPPIDLEINISCLFNEEKGILKVLHNIMGCKELEKIKQAILKFLIEFYKEHKNRLLLQQISNSRETFLMYAISTETTSKEKELALENLMCILEMKRLMLQVEVEDMLRALCDFEVEYKNPSFRVLRGIYQAMGLTCKQYRNTDAALVTRVVKVLLGVLVRQKSLHIANLKPLMVEGCFVGMKFIMMEYEIEKDEDSCLKLYGPLKHFLSTGLATGAHRGVQKTALQLLAEHGIKLSIHVYTDYKYWHDTFLSWAAHKNPELHRMGYAGLSTFYRIIAHTLKDKTGPEDKQIFQYFMQYFETTVSNKNLIKASYEVSLAIQGFGQFASPCKIHLTPRQVNEMFTNILSRAEEYLKQPTTPVQTLDYLPKYVQALGTIVAHIPSIGPQYRSTLQCLCVFLFERFPTMALYTHESSIVALLKTFESLSIKGTLIDTFLEEVVYQAIIRTCSHPVRMDADLLMENLTPFAAYQLITYDRFLPLWEGLLQISKAPPNSDFDPDRLEVIGSKVFDAFMLSLIKIVGKLDLETHEKTGSESMEVEMTKPTEASQPEDGSEIKEEKNIPLLEVIGMDPETSLVASHPKDFRVLLNLVDLCNDLLPKIGKQRFCHWALKFAQHLMIHSSQLPLVSSFYKLLTLCLKLSNQMELFKDIEKDNNTERHQCYQLLGKFLREVLTELVQYKGDLQMSCLYLVLASPLSLVPDLLPFAKPAFQAIFSMGESYLPLASAGVSALQIWSLNLPKETMQPLLVSTIPALDKFLHSKDQVDGSDSPLELVELQSRKHLRFRATRKAVQSQAGERDSELSQLQRDILMFLAQLDTPTCLALVDLQDTEVAEQAVAWSSTKLLEFKVPFNDVKPVIHLDIFLPRVMELALHCSDRHTRVTACELLHSSVMHILGTSVTLPAEGKARSELSKLFRHVAPAVLALGCDQDHLVRQMFQPTMLQLTHFCSSKPQLNSYDTAVLLQTLLDGITDQVDMSLRDFSAMCLKEFVVWSIKHTPHSEMSNSPVNIKRILRQMYAFSQHPCPFKRLGAALCVNSLYTVLREERDLVDQFWLELLFYLVSSLQLVGSGEAVVGTMQQTHKAIGHIERVLSEWSDLFNEPSRVRRQPPDFTGVCLKDALAWLLSLCSSPHSACRVVCIKLVQNLADKIAGAVNTMDGVKLCCEQFETEFVLLEVCEGRLFGREGLLQAPADNTEAESESMRHWIQQLLASLECYTWLLENELAQPNEIFIQDCQPNIFLAINKFVKIHFEDVISTYVLSPREKEEFESTKCKVLIQILDFLYFLMTFGESSLSVPLLSSNLSEISQPLWDTEWWSILCLIVMQPAEVGFTIKTHELSKELDEKLTRCLSIMPQKLPSSVFLQMQENFNKFLQGHVNELGNIQNLVAMVTTETPNKVTSYIKGCIILRQTGIACNLKEKFMLLLENDAYALVQKVFDCLIDEQAHTVPTIPGSNDLLNAILKLAFTFNVDIKNEPGKKKKPLEVVLLDKLNDQTTLEDDESQAFVTHGEIFLKRLKPTILDFLLETPTEAAQALVHSPLIALPQLNLYQFILTNVYTRPHLRLRYGCEVSAMVMRDWNRIRETEESHLLEVIDLMAYVAAMSAKDASHLQHIANWLYRHLSSESQILSIKTRCLDVAPALLTWDDKYRRTLRKGLDKMKQKLPLTSAEYPIGSSQCAEYKSFFLRLLALLRLTQDLELLEFVASIATREEEHICHEAIQTTLKAIMSRLPAVKQLEAIEKLFEIYRNEDNLSEVRLASINQFIIPMLQITSSNTTEQFFLNHISYLASQVLTTLKTGSSYRLQKQFVTRTASWNLFQLLYTKLPAESMKATSRLGIAFSPTKKLNQELLREAYNSRKEKLDIEDENKILYLKYQCAAYKAVISITCSLFPQVNENIKKYTEFIFKSKDSSHWFKIIDSEQNIELKMDFDEIPEKRKKLSCIRKIAKDIRDSVSSPESYGKSQTIRYLATHELFDSTLCEDVTRFDLSHVDVRSYTEPNEVEEKEVQITPNQGQEEVLLELDTINQHECMATLCALIRHLSSNTPTPGENPQPPDWMKCLREDLINDSHGQNIKLFIIKLIMNVEEVFKPYAKYWIEPICAVIAQKSIGSTINYVISDAIIMITSWHEIAIPTSKIEAVQASDVLTFLMENSYHPRRDIMRHSLELVKTIVEIWKPCISLNYQLLFNMIQPTKIVEHIEIGLQLAAILIANKLTPWNDIGKENYIENIVDAHLMNTTSKIYKLASEIIGMILKWSHDYPQIGIPNIREKTRQNLNTLLKEKGIFYRCLYVIHKHFNPIVDTFLNTIIFQYPNNLSEMKTHSLEMICSRIEKLDDQYKETKNLGLIQLLTSKSAENQEMALKLVAKLVLVMRPEEALPYVSQVPQIIAQCGPDARKMSYLLLMEVYRQHNEGASPEQMQLKQISVGGLMRGLCDSDESLQQLVLQFWTSPDVDIPASTVERFIALTRMLFYKEHSNLFLSNCVELLLEAATNTPDYNELIFLRGLTECKFTKYSMLASWRTQYAAMTPMFAETLTSQIASKSLATSSMAAGMLRATQQSFAFKPTVQEQEPESQDAEGLFFPNNTQDNKEEETEAGTTSKQKDWKRKYRFSSNAKRQRIFFAQRQIRLNSRKRQVMKEQKARTQAKVQMYREYRTGDFPDIQIPHSAIIKPLQALAKRDASIARQLFVSLFVGIAERRKDSNFIPDIETHLRNIFEENARCVPMLMGAVMEIALDTDLELQPNIISDVCTTNSLAPMGCLLLEKYLSHDVAGPTPSKRRRVSEEESEELRQQQKWLKMAELYQSLEERDIVLAVFQQALDVEQSETQSLIMQSVVRAVENEATQQWTQAQQMYRSFLDKTHVMDSIKDFSTEAYCKCLEKLSQWNEMNTWVREEISSDDVLDPVWTDSWNQEKLLPWLMKSEMHEILEMCKDERDFIPVISEWLRDNNKVTFLKSHYSEELSLLSLMTGEVEKARFHSRYVLQSFLEEWSVLSKLLPRLRAQKLGQLQTVAEIIVFAEARITDDEKEYIKKMKDLCLKWNISKPTPVDSLLFWESRIEYRGYFASNAHSKLQMLTTTDPSLKSELKRAPHLQELRLIDLAIQQKNFKVAEKFLLKNKKLKEDPELSLPWKITLSRAKWLLAEISSSPVDKLKCTLVALDEIRQAVESSEGGQLPGMRSRAERELAELAWAAAHLLSEHEDLADNHQITHLLNNFAATDVEGIVRELESWGQTQAELAVQTAQAEAEQGAAVSPADAMLCVVRHSRELIKSDTVTQGHLQQLVSCLLGAMKCGSRKARMLFPCLLQIESLGTDKDLQKLFAKEASSVPAWMFLGWTNQLLAHIDTNKVNAVNDLLLRLATEYPKALMLPFQFTLEKLEVRVGTPSAKTCQLVDRLREIVEPDRMMARMLKALSYISQPEIAFKGYLTSIIKCLDKPEQLKKIYKEMCAEVFPEITGDLQTAPLHGKIYDNFHLKHKAAIDKVLKPLMNKPASPQKMDSIKKALKTIYDKNDADIKSNELNGYRNRMLLKLYSPWLDQFHRSKYNCEIELPGQYTGEKMPRPQYHVTFSSFDAQVLIMASMRRPVKITVVGNDGYSYGFLVKAGEDLRQDERVQQLFGVMNEVLSQDPRCTTLRLHINTYQVVPINSHLGIIEFVKDCVPYGDFIRSNATELQVLHMKKAKLSYTKWAESKANGSKTPSVKYDSLYMKYPQKVAKDYFAALLNKMPENLLRQAFSRVSSSPEGLFWLRQSFASSIGVMNVAQWLLGIGDRHLSNMLVSQRTGAALGIDFGHAFGSATQLLPVPELVPFRLTEYMLALMGPLRHSGVIRASMVHSLRALRCNSELLLNTMQVFIQEPSLDWQENAAKLAENFAPNSEASELDSLTYSQEVQNYAQQKVRLTLCKIEGGLPVVTTEKELVTGRKNSSAALPYIVKVLRGDDGSLRSRLREKARQMLDDENRAEDLDNLATCSFTPEQQVDCLIEQATDHSILARTWEGWDSWV